MSVLMVVGVFVCGGGADGEGETVVAWLVDRGQGVLCGRVVR